MPNTNSDQPINFDPGRAKTAFGVILTRANQLSPSQLVAGNLNIIAAAIAAVGVANRCTEPALLARFKSLPASEFDSRHVEELPDLAWGTWHAARLARALKAKRTIAKLPADLVQLALEVEGRMQRCCEYHLLDHPVIGSVLIELRAGIDYPDLASDLVAYAQMYESEHAVLSKDTKHYRPTDRAQALRLSEQIIALLGEGMTAEASDAHKIAVRCFTLLSASYNEVAQAGRWLLRLDPNVDRLFPSLYTVARRAPSQTTEEEAKPDAGVLPIEWPVAE